MKWLIKRMHLIIYTKRNNRKNREKKVKVLMMCGFYPSETSATEGIFFHNQVKAIEKLVQEAKNADVDILLLDMRSIRKKRKFGYSEYLYDGVCVKRFALPCGPIPCLLPLLTRIAAKRGFSQYVKKYGKPDILHTHFIDMSREGCYLKKKYGIPLIVTEHSSSVPAIKWNSINSKKYRDVYNYADKVIAVGSALKNKINEITNRKIDVIPNTIPQCFFDACSPKDNKQDFCIISVGGLITRKRFDLTIQAFKKFHDDFPNSRLLIVGKGPLETRLRALSQSLDVAKAVQFLGQIDNRILKEYYALADCFVLPSNNETFGVVYGEAAAAGLPIIATKCGGPEDIVTDSNGILIPIGDGDALYRAMRYVYEHIGEYDARNISAEIKSKFGEKVVANELLSVYKEVMTKQDSSM